MLSTRGHNESVMRSMSASAASIDRRGRLRPSPRELCLPTLRDQSLRFPLGLAFTGEVRQV